MYLKTSHGYVTCRTQYSWTKVILTSNWLQRMGKNLEGYSRLFFFNKKAWSLNTSAHLGLV